MKTLTLLISLILLASCNDALRGRRNCGSATGASFCNEDALKAEDFRKMYIADITTPIVVGQSQFIIKEAAENSDFDKEMSCDLQVSANKQFSYIIDGKKLILKDGITTLRFTRTEGSAADGLVGIWMMRQTVENLVTDTELIFKDLEELHIRKTCNLK